MELRLGRVLGTLGGLALIAILTVVPHTRAHADASTSVHVAIAGSATVNEPLPNSGCYPSGAMAAFTSIGVTATGGDAIVRADLSSTGAPVVGALYSSTFVPTNTVAFCRGRSIATGSGGTASLTWHVPAGAQRAQWNLVLFSAAGAATVDVTFTGTDGLSVEGQPLSVITDSLPTATEGAEYRADVGAVNGSLPYTFTATGLPQGLSQDARSGTITGTPTAEGIFDVALTATDSSQPAVSATRSLRLQVAANGSGSHAPPSPSPDPTAGTSTNDPVGKAHELAGTGSDLALPAALALVTLLAGGLLLALRRRGRRAG
ncbi:hypothetical protein GCM10028798_24500 [Humibacter antri]